MAGVYFTRVVFIRGMAMVYMFAFASFYLQIPGLYGNKGILPAHLEVGCPGHMSLWECITHKPSLVWFSEHLGLDVEHALEVLALLGTGLSLLGFVFVDLCTCWFMLILWAVYLSLVNVGSTFMHFQWDILLLESGFLAALAAPLRLGHMTRSNVKDGMSMFMVRWLLFRLMFASGVVKLLSNCPTWWGLTALNWHYESQCIPTPLAWYAHQLPSWFQQLSVVATYLIEIPVPFLFFSPVRSARLFAFYCQHIFQLAIMLTGNYTFFNILTLVLCVSLLDDEWFLGQKPRKNKRSSGHMAWVGKLLFLGFVYLSLYLFTTELFSLQLKDGIVLSKTAFTPKQLSSALNYAVPISVASCLVYLLVHVFSGLKSSSRRSFFSLSYFAFFSLLYTFLFSASVVPFSRPLVALNPTSPLSSRVFTDAYSAVEDWHLAHPYGLFRTMTGVGGRPEIIVEAADTDGDKPKWKELDFRYKPGALDGAPSFVAPYQPRLDWQMWFAALSRPEHNPWLYKFIFRLLEGSKDVQALLSPTNKLFVDGKTPKQIRVSQYLYHYTDWRTASRNDTRSRAWWKRDSRKEYLKPLKKNSPELEVFERVARVRDPRTCHLRWRGILGTVRSFVAPFPPHLVLWSMLLGGILFMMGFSRMGLS